MKMRIALGLLLLLFSATRIVQAEILNRSIGAFLLSPQKERSVHGVAWDCIASSDIFENGESSAAQRLAQDAAELVTRAIRSRTDQTLLIGWTNDRTHRPCIASAESPCSGDKIVYAYQTGLALTCLSDAARLLRQPKFLDSARQVINYWEKLRNHAPCAGCIYYRISDSLGDQQRYIRNMNIFMGVGLAAYFKASGDAAYADDALAVVSSDKKDWREGFRGYVGSLDLQANAREKDRIENHLASMALMLSRIGIYLNNRPTRDYALTIWRDWVSCSNHACQTRDCKFWAADTKVCTETVTAAHCAFQSRDTAAKKACETYLAKVQTVGSFGIVSILSDKP